MVISQNTEVTKVSILVVDHSVEHQHALNLFVGLRSQFLIVVQAGFQPTLPHNTANGNIRCVNIGEQFAAGCQNTLPILQLVGHRVQAHGLGHLTGVKLTVWLVSGVCRAEGTPFVQVDPLALYETPCLGQHPVGRQFRRGGKGGVTLSDASVSHQGEDLGEAILVQIILCEGSREASGHHPVAVIEGQPLAHVDDPFGIIDAQTEGFQNFRYIGSILGDDPLLEPFQHTGIGQLHVQGQELPVFLIGPQQLGLQALDALLRQGEGQQIHIV